MSIDQDPLTVVLGGSGFVGTAVVELLATRPGRVRAVGRRPMTMPTGPGRVEQVRCDLTEPGALERAVDGASTVFYLLSAQSSRGDWRVTSEDAGAVDANVGLVGTLIDILSARSGTPTSVIFAGSISQGVAERLGDTCASIYDQHKMQAERSLLRATGTGRIRGVVLRLATLYSDTPATAALDTGVLAGMVRRAIAGQPLTVWGTMARDFVAVSDIAAAFVTALDVGDALVGRSWDVGGGVRLPVRDAFEVVAEAVGSALGRPPVAVESVAASDFAVPSDTVDLVAAPAPFMAVTGWSPRQELAGAALRPLIAQAHASAAVAAAVPS